MAASNTKDCFRECIGKKVIGVLFDALPRNRKDLSAGTKTLVFDDKTGLTITSEGAFWLETKEEIEFAVHERRRELESCKREIEDVLQVAGVI